MTGTRAFAAVATALVLIGFVAGMPSDAGACSCANGDAAWRYAHSDAAVIGVVEDASGETARIAVEQAFKAELGSTVELPLGDEASCGLALDEGERVGLLLSRGGDVWVSGTCGRIEPEELQRAAAPPPPPVGRGRAVLLAAGGGNGTRLVALDGAGRALAYGDGNGFASDAAVCPRSRRVVEVAGPAQLVAAELVVRRLRDLAVVRRERLPRRFEIEGITCRDVAGRHLIANLYGRDELHHVVRLRPGRRPERLRLIGYDNHGVPSFVGGAAFFNDGAQERDLMRLDLRTGRERLVTRTPPTGTQWVPSPAGTHLAGVDFDSPDPSQVVVVELRSGEVRTAPLAGRAIGGGVAWLDDRRIVHGGSRWRATFFDENLRATGRTRRVSGGEPVRAGSKAWVLARGDLRVLDPQRQRIRTVAELPSASFHRLVAVPGGTPVRLGRRAERARVLWLARTSLFG